METEEKELEEKIIKVNEQNDSLSMSNFDSEELKEIGGENAEERLNELLSINDEEKAEPPMMDSIMPTEEETVDTTQESELSELTPEEGINENKVSNEPEEPVVEIKDEPTESVDTPVQTENLFLAENEKIEIPTKEENSFLEENEKIEIPTEKPNSFLAENNDVNEIASTFSEEPIEAPVEEKKEEPKKKKKGFFASLFGKKEKEDEPKKEEVVSTENVVEMSENTNTAELTEPSEGTIAENSVEAPTSETMEEQFESVVTPNPTEEKNSFLEENEKIEFPTEEPNSFLAENNDVNEIASTFSEEPIKAPVEEKKEEPKKKKKGFLASLFGKKEKEEPKVEEDKLTEEKTNEFVSEKSEDAELPEVPELFSWDTKEDREKYITWLRNNSLAHPENEAGNNAIIAKVIRYGELMDGEVYEQKENIVLEPSKKEEETVTVSNIDTYNFNTNPNTTNESENKSDIQIAQYSVDTPEARADYIRELEKDTLENPDHAVANQNKINFIKSFGETGTENTDEVTKTI